MFLSAILVDHRSTTGRVCVDLPVHEKPGCISSRFYHVPPLGYSIRGWIYPVLLRAGELSSLHDFLHDVSFSLNITTRRSGPERVHSNIPDLPPCHRISSVSMGTKYSEARSRKRYESAYRRSSPWKWCISNSPSANGMPTTESVFKAARSRTIFRQVSCQLMSEI